MRFPVLGASEGSVKEFVEFWSPLYSYGDGTYSENIGLGADLTRDQVRRLMEWKSGLRHAKRAREVAERVDVEALNEYRSMDKDDSETLDALYRTVARPAVKNGIVWRIMLCHIARPLDYPIYDINVWHAWGCMAGWLQQKHLTQVPTKFETYRDEYRPFFLELQSGLNASTISDIRALDRALFSLGQFVSSQLGQRVLRIKQGE